MGGRLHDFEDSLRRPVAETSTHGRRGGIRLGYEPRPERVFLGTSRVCAVVVETVKVDAQEMKFMRTVYPTNNPQARVLRLEELKLFGEIAEEMEALCFEEL